MDYDVFISYSRKDTAIADRICAAFDRVGITCFIDRQGIGGGLEFPEILAEAIIGCRKVLFLASANSYASKFTNSEITFAFNRKEKNSIIPYCIDDCEMPIGLQFVFSGINWRTLGEHPIEPVLVDDVLGMLGRQRKAVAAPAAAKVYEVGDYYNENGREGIVFEVDAAGRHGKIMALTDLPQTMRWSLCRGRIGMKDIAEGMANFSVVRRMPEWQENYPAFAGCALRGDGWYLPAIGELKTMYTRRSVLSESVIRHGGKEFVRMYCNYWSSSEVGPNGAWAANLLSGNITPGHNKGTAYRVRPVALF